MITKVNNNELSLSGLLEESLQIPALDLDDVVVPAPAMSTTTPSPVLSPVSSQAGISTTRVASPSTSTNGEPDTIVVNQSVPLTNNQLTDEHVCREFVKQTCGCKKANGRACSSQFSVEYYIERRSQASLLSKNELDLVMLGSIMSTSRQGEEVTHGRHQPVKRQRPRVQYMHNGCVVCKATFGFIFGVGAKHKIDGIRKHYLEEGLAPKIHKNSTLRPHNALTFDEISSIVNFLQSYAEQNAILLPGRIPGYKRDDLKLLPSNKSKKVFYIHCTVHYTKLCFITLGNLESLRGIV